MASCSRSSPVSNSRPAIRPPGCPFDVGDARFTHLAAEPQPVESTRRRAPTSGVVPVSKAARRRAEVSRSSPVATTMAPPGQPVRCWRSRNCCRSTSPQRDRVRPTSRPEWRAPVRGYTGTIVDGLDSIRRVLEARSDVRLAYLFGSLVRGEARPKSDADIAVLFSGSPPTESLDPLVADLEVASGRGVDLIVLNDAPPLLAHEVVATGTRLVCRDEDERVRFVVRTVSRYVDTAHLRRMQQAYLSERTEARRARPR